MALEQYGGTIGGPIKKDKLFFFTAFEGQRYTIGATGLQTVPITGAGIFDPKVGNGQLRDSNLVGACQAALAVGAPGSGTPGALTALSAQLAGLSNTCVPLANYPGLFPANPGNNLIRISQSLPTENTIYSGIGKIDYHLSDKHSLNGMYFISPGDGTFNDSPASQTNLAFETLQHFRSMVFASNWTYTPNSAWVNEARVGYSHYTQSFLSGDYNQDPANYSFNGATYHLYTGQTNPFYFGLPAISIAGFQGTVGAGWPKLVGPDGTLQVLDHISYLRGKHSFKLGGEFLDFKSTTNVTANAKGPLGFDNLQDFFAGFPNGPPGCGGGASNAFGPCPGGSTATILAGNLLRHFSYQGYAIFFQDDWRIKPRVILNLGLRYELNTVQSERDNLQGTFDPSAATGMIQVGSGRQSPYNGDHNNFGPRIGVAWDMFGNGKTVLRAGGGILYEQISLDVFNGIGNSFGLRVPPTGASLVYTNSAGAAVVQPGPGTINVVNVAFSGTPVINNNVPGTIPFQWASNGPNAPIYPLVGTPACGDGNTAFGTTGFKPTPCNIMMVEPNFRAPYVSNWTLGLQRAITSVVSIEVGYVGNHGTKLIGAQSLNQTNTVTYTGVGGGVGTITTAAGWTAAQLALCATTPTSGNCKPNTTLEQTNRPFNAKFPYFKFIDEFGNYHHSNYAGMQSVLTVRNYHGITSTVGYTYSHALGDSGGQGTSGGLVIPINSYGSLHNQLYSSTTFDIRHRFTLSGTYTFPTTDKLPKLVAGGWSINAVAQIQTGTPWGVNDTTTDFAGTGEQTGNSQGNQGSQWSFIGNRADFTPQHNYGDVIPTTGGYTSCTSTVTANCVSSVPGVPWFPGSTALANAPTANAGCNSAAAARGPLATASLRVLGCYALGSSMLIPAPYGGYGDGTRNLFRDHGFRNLDFSVTKAFRFTEWFTAQFRAEFFNVLNHPNFTNPSGGPGGNGASLNAARAGSTGAGLAYVTNTPDQAGSNPVLGGGGARHVQLGLKLIF